MPETITVPLKTDPTKWVKIKAGWAYGDFRQIRRMIKDGIDGDLAMVLRCVVEKGPGVVENLEELHEDDGQAIAEAIAEARLKQQADRRPNVERASDSSSTEAPTASPPSSSALANP